MLLKIFKIIIVIAIGYAVFLVTTEDGAYWTRFKLYRLLLTKPIEKIRDDYSNKNCREFSTEEETSGYFEAFITGYCKPQANNYTVRKEFLCAVALNCSCPNGTDKNSDCASNSLNWKACSDFNEVTTFYCNKTASLLEPKDGHVAADWDCFPQGTPLEIEGKNYQVTDKGGVIKGRRFDVWFDSCDAALKSTGIYKVKIPKL